LNQAYSQPKPNKYFASFAPFLLENKEDYQCQKLIIQSFDEFFTKYVLKYPNQSPIGFVGSIAHHFGDILTQVAASHNLIISKIVEKPIDALVEFHQE
jgi:glucosamine kinase